MSVSARAARLSCFSRRPYFLFLFLLQRPLLLVYFLLNKTHTYLHTNPHTHTSTHIPTHKTHTHTHHRPLLSESSFSFLSSFSFSCLSFPAAVSPQSHRLQSPFVRQSVIQQSGSQRPVKEGKRAIRAAERAEREREGVRAESI